MKTPPSPGVQVRFRLAPPHLPVVQNRAAAQVGTEQVAVKQLVERGAGGVAQLLEAVEPRGRAAAAIVEGGLRQVV